jgi:acyl-CoA synthetase (AMP-forming)/AMP-acid ligase II
VEDVSVVPVEDEVAGELPLAFVVRTSPYIPRDEDDLEDELRTFVKDLVASFKQLRGGVRFVDSLPKSAAGKVLRQNLKEMAKQQQQKQQQRNRVVNGHGKDTESAGKEENFSVDAASAKLIGKVEIFEFGSDED